MSSSLHGVKQAELLRFTQGSPRVQVPTRGSGGAQPQLHVVDSSRQAISVAFLVQCSPQLRHDRMVKQREGKVAHVYIHIMHKVIIE